MKIDNTRYVSFISSPEKYRLTYELNMVPQEMHEYLQVGIAMHSAADMDFKGMSEQWLQIELERQGIQPNYMQVGLGYYSVLKEHLDTREGRRIASEIEFEIPLDSGHYFCGKIDGIAEANGIQFVDEFKTAGVQRKDYEFRKEFKAAPQCCGELIGARFLGYRPEWIQVTHVIKADPPFVKLPPIVETRTAHELNQHLRSVQMVCDMITMLREKYGKEDPWPHWIHSLWASDVRGSCNNDWCEYKEICQRPYEAGTYPAGFKERTEHLECIRRTNNET